MIPFVTIQLDKPRRLRLGMGALCEFEQLTGLRITELELEGISVDVIAKLLWVMLKQDDPEITLMASNAMVDEYCGSLTEVISTVGRAIEAAFGTGEKRPNPKTPAGKGR